MKQLLQQEDLWELVTLQAAPAPIATKAVNVVVPGAAPVVPTAHQEGETALLHRRNQVLALISFLVKDKIVPNIVAEEDPVAC